MGNYDCPKCGWDYEVISEKCTVCGYTWKKKRDKQ